jgi:hypothetical protein
MRSRLPCLAVIAVAATTNTARADLGYYQEGGIGTARAGGGLDAFEDGGLAVRGALGYRRAHFGGEMSLNKAELRLRDELGAALGAYTALTLGPMFTARVSFARTEMDAPFARWWELYGRLGPTHTWMYGDPGTGPPDGTSGFGFAAGAGLRWVYAAAGLSLDITYVHANLHKDRVHDPRDEAGLFDVPAVDLQGGVIATTLGFGFVL